MFEAAEHRRGSKGAAFATFELIYHSAVRSIRRSHNNAFVAIVTNLLQSVLFVASFYIMFSMLGLRGMAIRGDFLLYIMSGIFIFMVHIKVVGAVVQSEGPSNPMMQHAPMNTVIAIASAALGSLYIQVLCLFIILFVYYTAFVPFTIEQPVAAFGMLLLAWFTGVAIGIVLLAMKPWAPAFVSVFTTIYQRASMIASGKMFVANMLPAHMLAMFDWNPLFHCIDQARGFVFINYNPMFSSWQYAFWVGVVLLMIGLMGEFYTRRSASLSWSAKH